MSKIQDSKDKKNQNVLTREEYRQRLASHGKVNVWDSSVCVGNFNCLGNYLYYD